MVIVSPFKSNFVAREVIDVELVPMYIHPSTSELAKQLVTDPMALANENYSGIYDAAGDYVPQYCDNPEKIPQGAITANPDSATSSGVSATGNEGRQLNGSTEDSSSSIQSSADD